jgi:hypothetical protein
MATSPTMSNYHKPSYCDVVKCLVRGARQWSTNDGEVYPNRPVRKWYGEPSCGRTQVDPGTMIFTRSSLSTSHSARITATDVNCGATVVGGEGEWTGYLLQLLYHGIHLQLTWQSNLKLVFLLNSLGNLLIDRYESCHQMIHLQTNCSHHTQTSTESSSK